MFNAILSTKVLEKGPSWITNDDVLDIRKVDTARQDSDATVDSGVDVGMDRSHSSSSSLSAVSTAVRFLRSDAGKNVAFPCQISPVVTRPKRHRHKLQRLAAVEDEDSLAKSKPSVRFPPYEYG